MQEACISSQLPAASGSKQCRANLMHGELRRTRSTLASAFANLRPTQLRPPSPKGAKAGFCAPFPVRKRSGTNLSASTWYLGLRWKLNCAVCEYTGQLVLPGVHM